MWVAPQHLAWVLWNGPSSGQCTALAMVLILLSWELCWIPACDCPWVRGSIYLLIFLQKNVLEHPSTSAVWKALWAVVDLHRLIQIPFGDLQWFSSISSLACGFLLPRGNACLHMSQLLWLSDFSWPVQGALWSSGSAGSMCALSWGTHLLSIGKLVFSGYFHTAPTHTLSCLVTELLGLCCCCETSAPIFMQCLCTVITGREGPSKQPRLWVFFTSLTVLHSWRYYFMAATDWNILWCFKEPLFHCGVPESQWLFMDLK